MEEAAHWGEPGFPFPSGQKSVPDSSEFAYDHGFLQSRPGAYLVVWVSYSRCPDQIGNCPPPSCFQKSGDTAANTEAGDKYTGLDRFGRGIDQVWRDATDTVIDRYQYGYDRVGNRTFRNNLLSSGYGELYDYDDLNQLTDFARGVLSDSNSDGILDTVASPSRTQAWDLDAMGNWQSLSTNGTGQSRSHNAQNQVTGVGSATLAFDANGSMTTDEFGAVQPYDLLILESP